MVWSNQAGLALWSPVQEMRRLQSDFDRFFRAATPHAAYPPTNVYVSDDEVALRAEVPGFGPEHVDISVEEGVLQISGRVPARAEADESEGGEQRFERAFDRSFQLPFRVDADSAKARVVNGILEVAIPRAEEDRVKRIQITG